MFITLDGIDGVGKSTQISRLEDYLRERGHETLSVRDPGSTDVGARLRSLLLDSDLQIHRRTEAMLFMASRCEMVESMIRPALVQGKTVISDRFLLSTVVYQSIHDDPQHCVDPELLWSLGRLANGDLSPDLTILLDLPAEISFARFEGEGDRLESRGVDYLERVRQAFLTQLANSRGATVVVDASKPIDEVEEAIRNAVDAILGETNP